MNAFETLAKMNLPCDICGGAMIVINSGGWDNDIIYCPDVCLCGSEITFATSTEHKEEEE